MFLPEHVCYDASYDFCFTSTWRTLDKSKPRFYSFRDSFFLAIVKLFLHAYALLKFLFFSVIRLLISRPNHFLDFLSCIRFFLSLIFWMLIIVLKYVKTFLYLSDLLPHVGFIKADPEWKHIFILFDFRFIQDRLSHVLIQGIHDINLQSCVLSSLLGQLNHFADFCNSCIWITTISSFDLYL